MKPLSTRTNNLGSILIHGAIALALTTTQAFAAGEDDPLLAKVVVDQFEYRDGSGENPLVWEAEGWLGKDLDKLWLKTEGERVNGLTEELELQLLYSRALSPYWDLQLGWRHDKIPDSKQDWFAIGFKGVAPYLFETDATLYIADSGQFSASLQAEYELMITQRWVIVPELEVTAFSKNDEARGIGSGLADTELGVRLHYEIRREFAPYIGFNWNKLHGNSADFAREEGEKTEGSQWVVGVRIWF